MRCRYINRSRRSILLNPTVKTPAGVQLGQEEWGRDVELQDRTTDGLCGGCEFLIGLLLLSQLCLVPVVFEDLVRWKDLVLGLSLLT